MAVAIYDGLLGFEYGIVAELFGLVRPGTEEFWYEYLPCRVERGELKTTHGLTIEPKLGLKQLASADIVVIPGWRSPDDVPKPAFVEAIRTAYDNGARIISVCSGVFVLGHAGLLDRKRATAHWLHTEALRNLFPKANVVEDRLYTHDRRISTSAGCSAGMDLCLSVIRNDFGIEVANMVARRMVAPVHREGGQSQYIEPTVLSTDDEEFGPVLDWMTRHLSESFSVDDVANEFSMSLRTFQRRFRNLTGLPPLVWINQNRVNKARAMLEATDLSIEQIAFQAGLGSTANLRKHFGRVLGATPSAYRSAFHFEQ